MEIPLSNGRFTWERDGSVNSRFLIDPFFISKEWNDAFENAGVTRQTRLLSDHFPLMLESGSFEWVPTLSVFAIVGCSTKNVIG